MTRASILMMGPYPEWDMRELETRYAVHKWWETADKDGLLRSHGGAIRAIATRGELGAGRDLIDRLSGLELIACYGVGTDAIDLAAARERGIRVTNTPDVLTGDVADMAIGLMLSAARRIRQGDAHVRAGAWPERGMDLTTRLFGKRIGIVGMGRIGSALARRAAAFDMQIAYCGPRRHEGSPYPFHDSVAELAGASDFLVATLAGGAATAGLIGADAFAALGPDGYFVNVARGSVVDETALLEALESGAIKGAALDVFHNEPRIDARFLKLDNVVLQPHHSSGTVETRKAMGQMVRDNLAAHFAGRPLLSEVA